MLISLSLSTAAVSSLKQAQEDHRGEEAMLRKDKRGLKVRACT
jgi:hypothetical protein